MDLKGFKVDLLAEKKALNRLVKELFDVKEKTIFEKDKKKISAIQSNALATVNSIQSLLYRLQAYKDKKLFN